MVGKCKRDFSHTFRIKASASYFAVQPLNNFCKLIEYLGPAL